MTPIYRSAITALHLPSGTGLDAGCGPGGVFPLLDAVIGQHGSLVGIDGSAIHLARAEHIVKTHDLGQRVRLQRLDLRQPLPFPDKSFDWVWCADVLWPSLFPDPQAVVDEFTRVVKRGGTVAIFFANMGRALMVPGEPGLDQRLSSAVIRMWDPEPTPPSRHPEMTGS